MICSSMAPSRARALTAEFVRTLERAGPYGSGNPEPLIALPAISWPSPTRWDRRMCASASSPATALSSTAWPSAPSARSSAVRSAKIAARPLHVAGYLAIDRWQGAERVQFRVADVAVPDPGPAVIR